MRRTLASTPASLVATSTSLPRFLSYLSLPLRRAEADDVQRAVDHRLFFGGDGVAVVPAAQCERELACMARIGENDGLRGVDLDRRGAADHGSLPVLVFDQ